MDAVVIISVVLALAWAGTELFFWIDSKIPQAPVDRQVLPSGEENESI